MCYIYYLPGYVVDQSKLSKFIALVQLANCSLVRETQIILVFSICFTEVDSIYSPLKLN